MQNLLNEFEVAERLNLSVATLRRWRIIQRGPLFVKVGFLVRYRPEDLESWLTSRATGGSPLTHEIIARRK